MSIQHMKTNEKIALGTGADAWHTRSFPQYNLPSIMMSDGPHGVRCQRGATDMLGVHNSEPATCFPPAVTAGATWNPELYAAEGEAIGKEALSMGVSVVLGPGCNIKRNPLGGRSFEYLSEDPVHAGTMAAAFINGQQSTGAVSCLKHFAVNSQEYKRMNGDSLVDERTLREIYLKPFEIAVKESHPGTVMCAYNKVNGTYCSDNQWLLTEVLRDEWGFDGLVMTDWGAMNDRIAAYKAGCDLTMPGGHRYMNKAVEKAIEDGRLSMEALDRSVQRVLDLTARCRTEGDPVDLDDHHVLAQLIAEQGAVLMKNEDGILPCDEKDMVLIGFMAKNMRYQGAGSSHINPVKVIQPVDAMPDVPWVDAGNALGEVSAAQMAAAVEAADQYRVPVVMIGLPETWESEGFDREHMRLPEGYNKLAEAVCDVNPNTVVVLFAGCVCELPWADKAGAILYMGLPGQAGGQAAANLLTGRAVPSGKLTETWPLTYDDVISRKTFGMKNPEYREGLYVGYRYYNTAGMKVRYPFGHGLSYTTFSYENLIIQEETVSFDIVNTGEICGAEVVQLYVKPPRVGIYRPAMELKAYQRVELEPGERSHIVIPIEESWFQIWEREWKTGFGTYDIAVGSSSRDIRLEGQYSVRGRYVNAPRWQKGSWYETLNGEPEREVWEQLMGRDIPEEKEPVRGEYTMNSTLLEMQKDSRIIRLMCKATKWFIGRGFKGEKSMEDPAYKMMITCALDCPIRSMIMNSGGALGEGLAKWLVKRANGRKK